MRRPRRGAGRTSAVLAVLALAAGACSSGSHGATPTTHDASTSSTVGSGGDGGSSSTLGAGASGGGGTAGQATGTGATSSTTAAPAGSIIPIGSGRVGDVAAALLRPGRGNRVVVEVRAQSGAAPTSGTIDHVVSVLRDASGKAVAVDGVDAIGGGARSWTQQGIVSAAAAVAQAESGRTQVVVRLLFLHGTYEGDTSILGVAVSADVAAIFSDQIDSAAGLLVSPSLVEDAVTTHEVGHLLALVDLILHTGRGDPAHPGHSRNKRSVMYWQVESDLVTQLLDGGIPRDFDADDRAELATIRAG